MSDSEDDHKYCFLGKPLELYDEESLPKKQPIHVSEQIATDEHGRRRFHGAFTGGFSAGFFNTVGSLEGWKPTEFKSSRSERAKGFSQKPQDFMDDEDMNEYGLAPQGVRATDDYRTSLKRKKQVFSDGPIPGDPVLHNILTCASETIGYMLLKNMKLRDRKLRGNNKTPDLETYNPDIEDHTYEIPKIYKDYFNNSSEKTMGLGYVGLQSNQKNYPDPNPRMSKFVFSDKSNKKLSIAGQAFGVGAFEDEEDDIYMKDDISKYDFELLDEAKTSKTRRNQATELIHEMFVKSKKGLLNKRKYCPPTIPHSFTGKHKVRKSRFEPASEENDQQQGIKMNAMIRARYLGEPSEILQVDNADSALSNTSTVLKVEPDNNRDSSSSAWSYLNDKFVSTSEKSKNTNPEDSRSQDSLQEGSTSSSNATLTSLYLSDKFVPSSKKDSTDILEPVEKFGKDHITEQMMQAVKMKMFGALTRVSSDWVPESLLCKRFNVPEPFVTNPVKQKTHTKSNIIFNYQQHVEQENLLKPGLSDSKSTIKEEPICIKTEQDSIDSSTKDQDTEHGTENIAEPSGIPEFIIDEPHTNHPVDNSTSAAITDLTAKINLEEQQDLFSAVFMSDSESEEEHDESRQSHENVGKTAELKSAVLSSELVPTIPTESEKDKADESKTVVSEVLSVPKGIVKEGLLSGINLGNSSRIIFKKPEKDFQDSKNLMEQSKEHTKIETSVYGPVVPKKTLHKVDVVDVLSSDGDEWVEKDCDTKIAKHKKKKKHKSEKKKHKHKKKH